MAEIDVCPISLQPIADLAFAHDGVSFDACVLHQHISKTPSAVNPVTRAVFEDADIQRLNEVLQGHEPPLPVGRARAIAAESVAALDALVDYLTTEARGVLLTHLQEWTIDDTAIDFYTSMANCVAQLEQIHMDLCSTSPHGQEQWIFVLGMLKKEQRGNEFADDIFTGLQRIAAMSRVLERRSTIDVPPYSRHSPLLNNTL